MNQKYYKLPLELGSIIGKNELVKCSLKESIAHHLHLVLTTSFGELLSDPGYGNHLWEEDFDNVSYRNRQKENILQSLTQTISKYEKRLEKVKVEMNVFQEETPPGAADTRVKRKLEFIISGSVKATNELILYRDSFFISPLAYN